MCVTSMSGTWQASKKAKCLPRFRPSELLTITKGSKCQTCGLGRDTQSSAVVGEHVLFDCRSRLLPLESGSASVNPARRTSRHPSENHFTSGTGVRASHMAHTRAGVSSHICPRRFIQDAAARVSLEVDSRADTLVEISRRNVSSSRNMLTVSSFSVTGSQMLSHIFQLFKKFTKQFFENKKHPENLKKSKYCSKL